MEKLIIKGGSAKVEAAKIASYGESEYEEFFCRHVEAVPEHRLFLEDGTDLNIELVFKTRKRPGYCVLSNAPVAKKSHSIKHSTDHII